MRELRKWAWAAVVAAVAAGPASAQQGTGTTTPSGRTTSSLTGTGGLAGGGTGALGGSNYSSTSCGGTTGGGGNSTGGTDLQGTALQTMQAAPKLAAPTGTAAGSLDAKTNRFAGYYANPYVQGNTIQVNAAPGGFGIPVVAGAGTTGRGAVTSGAGRTGIGGIGGGIGGQNNANQSGIIIPMPAQIAYTARMQFPTPPVPAGKIVSEVRAIIDKTPAIADAKAVQVITDANNNVTLRGSVKDDDEARLIEGLVRITPGVGAIRNELTLQVASR